MKTASRFPYWPHFLDGHRHPWLHRERILQLIISLFKYPGEREGQRPSQGTTRSGGL
jgi:hypothetical protein